MVVLHVQGPWVDFVEMVVLLLAGNASFMAGCVYLPLNIGRLMLMAIKKASTLMTQVSGAHGANQAALDPTSAALLMCRHDPSWVCTSAPCSCDAQCFVLVAWFHKASCCQAA
jgi:hypothetical protein